MTHLDLTDKEIHARIDRSGHLEKFPANVEGVRALWKRMGEEEEHGAMEVLCSSSVDFPEEAGLSEDFDLRAMLTECKISEEEQDIQEMFGAIDKMVQEGDIQGLAKRIKRYMLNSFGRNPDEYNL